MLKKCLLYYIPLHFHPFQAKKRALIEAEFEDARRHPYKDDDLALVGEDEFHEVEEEGPSEKKFVPNSAPPPPPTAVAAAAGQSSACLKEPFNVRNGNQDDATTGYGH